MCQQIALWKTVTGNQKVSNSSEERCKWQNIALPNEVAGLLVDKLACSVNANLDEEKSIGGTERGCYTCL